LSSSPFCNPHSATDISRWVVAIASSFFFQLKLAALGQSYKQRQQQGMFRPFTATNVWAFLLQWRMMVRQYSVFILYICNSDAIRSHTTYNVCLQARTLCNVLTVL
jgi:hypothetical protein